MYLNTKSLYFFLFISRNKLHRAELYNRPTVDSLTFQSPYDKTAQLVEITSTFYCKALNSRQMRQRANGSYQRKLDESWTSIGSMVLH